MIAKAKRKLWKIQIRDTLEPLNRDDSDWLYELMHEGFFVSTNEYLGRAPYRTGSKHYCFWSRSSHKINGVLYEKCYNFYIEGGYRILHEDFVITWFCNSKAGQLKRVYNEGKIVSFTLQGVVWDNVDPTQPLYKEAKFHQVNLLFFEKEK